MTSRSRGFGISTTLIMATIVLVRPTAAAQHAPHLRSQQPSAQTISSPIASIIEPIATPLAAALPATPDEMIQQMAQQAGVIFAGQVLAVRRPLGFAGSAQDAAEGVVEIDFLVDEPVLGPNQATIYTLREWAGLWTGGTDRYRTGQRLLMFLRTPDAQGLSSPVHGSEGIIPLRGDGIAPGPDSVFTTAAEWLADLRWIEAQTLPAPSYTSSPGFPVHRPPHGPVSEQIGGNGSDRAIIARTDAIPPSGYGFPALKLPTPWLMEPPKFLSTDAPMEPLAQILSLCRNQVKASDASH